MELRYKNYRLTRANEREHIELRNFFGGIKNGCSVRILSPKHILPEEVLDNCRETNELDFYDILPASEWADEKLSYCVMHHSFSDSEVAGDITNFMKMAKHDMEYISDAYHVKNPQLNFVTVEDLQRRHRTGNAKKAQHFSMVRGLIKMRWEDGLHIAVNPDYHRAKMGQVKSGFALSSDETGDGPKYLFASQKLIDERMRGTKLHTSIFDLDRSKDIAQ
jgi:hypothetical protein